MYTTIHPIPRGSVQDLVDSPSQLADERLPFRRFSPPARSRRCTKGSCRTVPGRTRAAIATTASLKRGINPCPHRRCRSIPISSTALRSGRCRMRTLRSSTLSRLRRRRSGRRSWPWVGQRFGQCHAWSGIARVRQGWRRHRCGSAGCCWRCRGRGGWGNALRLRGRQASRGQ